MKTADWKRQYPDNPAPMIRTWLTNFLDESSTVDFNAELIVETNGRKLFANKEYEKKSYLWKLCYRAGKETITAARTSAQSWLNEL